MLSNHLSNSTYLQGTKSDPLTRPRSYTRFVLTVSLAAAAITLSGCGGSSGGDTLAGFIADDFAGDREDGLDGGLNGTIVQTGPYAGLNEECVNTLIPFTPLLEFVSLTCDPRFVDVDTSLPINQNSDDDPVFPTVIVPVDNVDTVDTADEIINLPVNTPGLNTAPPDIAGGSYYQESRVTALLTGPTFGTGERLNSDLVKPLAVQVESVETGLELLEIRAVQDNYGNATADILGIVRNTSLDFQCAITLRGLQSFSADGAQLGDEGLDFGLLDGEIGGSTSGFFLSSCLEPGSVGYLMSNRDVPYGEVAEIRVDELTSSLNYERFDASLVPLSYSVAADGSASVTVVNNYTETLDLTFVKAIAIDDQGHGFATTIALSFTEVMPGEEVIIDGLFDYFDGSSSTMRVILDAELAD